MDNDKKTERKNWWRWVWWLPAVGWAVVIFSFSAAPGAESDATSLGFLGNFISDPELVRTLNYPIRKVAHASIYLLLAALVMLALTRGRRPSRREWWRVMGMTVGICLLYACTDEWHQTLVPNRAGKVTDVLVDTAGATAGCAVWWIVWRLRETLRRRR